MVIHINIKYYNLLEVNLYEQKQRNNKRYNRCFIGSVIFCRYSDWSNMATNSWMHH